MKIDLVKQRFNSLVPNLLDIIGDDLPVRVFGIFSRAGSHEQAWNVKVSTTDVAMEGGAGTVTVTGALLAKKFILGLCGLVTTVIAGTSLTTYKIGDGSDDDRYGTGIAKAAGTTVKFSDATANPTGWNGSAADVVFTAAAGQFDSGVFELSIFYFDLTAPTS